MRLSIWQLLFICLGLVTNSMEVYGQDRCEVGAGMTLQHETQNSSSTISEFGQFIDLVNPATCNGEISKIFFCYSDSTEVSTDTREVTLRIWRLMEGSTHILEIVDEYIFAAPISSTGDAYSNTSCTSELIQVGETVKFQEGDFIGFLFPSQTGLQLVLEDDVLADEGVGLYRDNRSKDNYELPLDKEEDLFMEVGFKFNINVEVNEMPFNSIVTPSLTLSVMNSENLPNSFNQLPLKQTSLSSISPVPVTMPTKVAEGVKISESSMESHVHASMSIFQGVMGSSVTPNKPPLMQSLPIIIQTHDKLQSEKNVLAPTSVAITSQVLHTTATTTLSFFTPAFRDSTTTIIHITKSVNKDGESTTGIIETLPTPTPTVLAADDDLGLLSPYSTNDEDILSLVTASSLSLFGGHGSTTSTNTEESLLEVLGNSPSKELLMPSHLTSQLNYATNSIDLSSSLPLMNDLEESPIPDGIPDGSGGFNGGSGESEYFIEVSTMDTAMDNEQFTIFNTESMISKPTIIHQGPIAETESVMPLGLSSNSQGQMTSQKYMSSLTFQQSLVKSTIEPSPTNTLSSVDITMPLNPQSSLKPSLSKSNSPLSQIPAFQTTIPQLSSSIIIRSSTNVVIDTTSIRTSSTKNAILSSAISRNESITSSNTSTYSMTLDTYIPIKSITFPISIIQQVSATPTFSTTDYFPGYESEANNGLATWVSLLVILFAALSGCIMFGTLYFAHIRKIAQAKNSPNSSPNNLFAIDNPSYSVKSSEDNDSQPILMDTYTEECLDQASPIHTERSGNNDNPSRDSPLMDGSGHSNLTVAEKNSPSKNISIGNLGTDLSTDKGPAEIPSLATAPKNAMTAVDSNIRDAVTDDKRLSSALSGRTHDYEEVNNDTTVAGIPKRQSHQYEEPESIPEERPPTEAQDYEKPISLKSQHPSLTCFEEDSEVLQEVLQWKNFSDFDETSDRSDLASESISMVSCPQRIRHYAECSLYPAQWCASPLYPSKPKRTFATQKNHSFSYSKGSRGHDYEEPIPQELHHSHSSSFVPLPSPSFKTASDYEVPLSSKSLQRTQSTKPEQLTMALKRRNRLSLIFEADFSKVEEDSVLECEEFGANDDSSEKFNAMKVRMKQNSTPSSLKSSLLSQVSEMDGAYIEPSSDEQELNSEINRQSVTAIPYSAIESDWRRSEPEQRAVWKRDLDNSRLDVTIRSPDSTDTDSSSKLEILQEVAMMAQFRHPNIVKLHGAVNDGRHTILVSEYFHRGDLRKVLVQMGRSEIPSDTPQLLLSYSQQAALGMQYLASKGFVHRDLSARNVYVSKNDICKVGGFDKSRELANVNDYIAKGGKMQVRWMAPEAIHHCQYSTASDVWSYGCLLYEIWSLGRMPFRDNTNSEVIDKVDSGYRLPPPPGCPLVIYNLMMQCWHPNPFSRPTFKSILSTLLKDEDSILKIPIKDASTHSSAIILGASLKAGSYMYSDLQQKYARKASHINRRSVSFKTHDYDHIEDEKFMLSFPTSSADLASERKSKKQQHFEFEESCDIRGPVPRPTLYSEPVVVSEFSQSLPLSTWKGSDYEDIIDL